MIQLRSLCSIARSEFNKTLKVRAGILCLVLVGPLGGVLGCAGQKEFQQTARVTLYQISEYENQVNQKAAAENAYAKTMVEILQASARREAYNSEQVLVNGRRNAFAAHVIQDGGKTQGAEITDFANGLITAVADNRKASDSLEKAYAVDLPASVERINANTASLTPVTTDLTELQANQSTSDQLKTWITFGSQLRDKYQSTPEKNQ